MIKFLKNIYKYFIIGFFLIKLLNIMRLNLYII